MGLGNMNTIIQYDASVNNAPVGLKTAVNYVNSLFANETDWRSEGASRR
jgi:hypothetical protein